jgi:hypothetical protein
MPHASELGDGGFETVDVSAKRRNPTRIQAIEYISTFVARKIRPIDRNPFIDHAITP